MTVQLVPTNPPGAPLGPFADETEAHAKAKALRDEARASGVKPKDLPRFRIAPPPKRKPVP
jgi:hypothetical protein